MSTTTDLTVRAEVSENKMHLRQAAAEAKLPDGTKVEIATNVDGSMLITIDLPGQEGWRTYALTPEALVDAVLKIERPA